MFDLEKRYFQDFLECWKRGCVPESSGLLYITGRMQWIGVLPMKIGPYTKRWSQTLMKVCLWSQYVDTVFQVWGLMQSYKDPVVLLEAAVNLLGGSLITYKLYEFQSKADSVLQLVSDFEEKYVKGIKGLSPDMKERVRFCYMENYVVNHASGYLLAPGLIMSFILPPLILWQRILPLPVSYPWNTTDSDLGYFSTFILQSLLLIWRITIIAVVDSFGVGTLHYSNMLFEILARRMKMLWNCGGVAPSKKPSKNSLKIPGEEVEQEREVEHQDPDRAYEVELVDLIQEHQSLLNLVTRLNKNFSNCFVAQLVASTFMLCLSGFQIVIGLKEKNLKLIIMYSVYFVAVLCQLVFWCYNGNKIYWTSNQMSVKLLACDWIEVPKKLKKDLMFLFARVQIPFGFKAGYLAILNYDTLVWIIQKSYSFFALMTKMLN